MLFFYRTTIVKTETGSPSSSFKLLVPIRISLDSFFFSHEKRIGLEPWLGVNCEASFCFFISDTFSLNELID